MSKTKRELLNEFNLADIDKSYIGTLAEFYREDVDSVGDKTAPTESVSSILETTEISAERKVKIQARAKELVDKETLLQARCNAFTDGAFWFFMGLDMFIDLSDEDFDRLLDLFRDRSKTKYD
jgi:hypothetical protein